MADSWREKGHYITATTTRADGVAELKTVVNRMSGARGEDANAVQAVIQNQDRIVVSVA